eukprot:618422-Alexandrium_andersonii.AAC.1
MTPSLLHPVIPVWPCWLKFEARVMLCVAIIEAVRCPNARPKARLRSAVIALRGDLHDGDRQPQ